MNTANTNYELHILKTAINNHLDRTLPSDASQALHLIQYQIDDLVWNIATSIYSQSGYKVDFSLVRDLTNTRIESLNLLAARQPEEVRLRAEAEARRKAEEERKEWIQEQRYKAQKELIKTEKTERQNGLNPELFYKIKSIIVDRLEIDSDRVTPEASFANDLGADGLDMLELIMAFEEKFDIKLAHQDFVKRRPLFSSAMEDEYVYSWVKVKHLVRLVE